MINMNNKMKKIIIEKEGEKHCLKINTIVNEIVNKTKIVKDCIIFDIDGSLEEDKINFSKILNMVGDRTGYEVSCNEIRISQEGVNASELLTLADELSILLYKKYNKNIVVYISLFDDEIELRFHTFREDERLWLDKNLDKYDIPILCLM